MTAPDEDLKPSRGYIRRLPPEIEKLRDRIVDRFAGEPLSEISTFVQKVLATEKNEVNRLAALAARVVLIRNYINEVMRLNNVSFMTQRSQSDEQDENSSPEPEHIVMIASDHTTLQEGMRRVKIIEDSTVHDVLFPAGITVDVKDADAERLTSSGKAEYVELAAPAEQNEEAAGDDAGKDQTVAEADAEPTDQDEPADQASTDDGDASEVTGTDTGDDTAEAVEDAPSDEDGETKKDT